MIDLPTSRKKVENIPRVFSRVELEMEEKDRE
jgi:hypothetical protein